MKLSTKWFNNKFLLKKINDLNKENEALRIENKVLKEEMNSYKDKVVDIKCGKLILISNKEKKILEKHIENLEKEYVSLQNMISEEERMSGICYDGLSDYYYAKYYVAINAFKNALKDDFKLNINLPSIEDIKQINKSKNINITENAIELGRYL